jgi:predicted nucleic acid-binding protein
MTAARIKRSPTWMPSRSGGRRTEACFRASGSCARAPAFYDAAYLALAEALGVAVLTAGARLARSAGARCEIELVP